FVFQFKFPLEAARGFSLLDKNPPVIAINSTDNILARIFTLFHEYAHILLGITEIYQEEVYKDQQIENWCDTFASEILVPESALKKDEDFQKFSTSKQIQPDLLEQLSQKFKVSKKAILTRLRTLNLITFDEYQEQSKKLEQTYQPKKKGFITPAQRCIQEKGPSFISYVLQSKEKGIITTHDALECFLLSLSI
ncbi:MAG: ImmA/IrrE family metallo-endopeptidase, partial [Deltaproteobacteria bacterium]|nr:ImmA/IrrE family metallo-endopeptidase [Deltaproteobacteria bacterium]